MSTLFIVEDQRDLGELIADYARAAGFTPELIADGREALARAKAQPPTLMVLDLMLPGLDGLSVCRAVRGFSALPIIMVTAKVEELDRLLGLEVGADDYLCKPFSPRELMARIKAVLRRAQGAPEHPPLLRVDEASRTVFLRSSALDLTPTEFSLLAAMARRPGVIFSRAQLLELARRDSLDVADRAIDSHIKNLRRKIVAILPEANLIRSVYGLGYRLER
jgi:two-component system, OmpR family, response regulator BaeR